MVAKSVFPVLMCAALAGCAGDANLQAKYRAEEQERLAKLQVGKTWIDEPMAGSPYAAVRLCSEPGKGCSEIQTQGAFDILSIKKSGVGDEFYELRAHNGKIYYTAKANDAYFVKSDPVPKRKAAAEECAKQGKAPRIGMTREQVLQTCWGLPTLRTRTEVARGVIKEQFVYGPRGTYLYLTNGTVDFIHE